MSKFVEINNITINMDNITAIVGAEDKTRIYFNGSDSDFFDFNDSYESIKKLILEESKK